jgi:hypothetical protein
MPENDAQSASERDGIAEIGCDGPQPRT